MLDWTLLADRLTGTGSAFALRRGSTFAIANEAALKFTETCGLHGPAAIVQAHFPVLALGVDDAALATAARLAAQGADEFVTRGEVKGVLTLPSIPGLRPLVTPLVLATAYCGGISGLARRRGLGPDTPSHLRKITETV